MKKLLIYVAVGLFLFSGCKKQDRNNTPGNPGTVIGNFEIQIDVPSGSTIDLAGGTVLSGMEISDIKSKEKVSVTVFEGTKIPAYVFDKNERLIMMGFIGGDAKVISPATTAEVLLHWGLGLPFLDSAFTGSYLRQFKDNAIAQEWVKAFEQSFSADPLILSKGSFMEGLTATVKGLHTKGVLDVNAKKVADIKVDAANVKSGIRVQEDGLSMYSVNNYYRRRAHGFLYKKNYKDLNGGVHNILNQLTVATKADKDFAIGARSGITSVMGEIGKWVEDKTMESMVAKTGPNELQLEDNESEALYQLRVVGPGTPVNFMTLEEGHRLGVLSVETFLFDFAVPALSIAASSGSSNEFEWKKSDKEVWVAAFINNLEKSSPDIYEEVMKGKMWNALIKFLENVKNDAMGSYLTAMLEGLEDMGFKNVLTNKTYKVPINAILGTFDLVLSSSDLMTLATNIATSRSAESFDITARTGEVTLTPAESAGTTGSFIKLEAIIKNMNLPEGTHPFFEWRTTGKYGELRDNQGHRGASFESQDAKPQFYVSASGSQLSDNNNLDYVYVKAMVGSQVVGTDTAVINVKKFGYKITPAGITLSGKAGTTNEVVLYLRRTDGQSDIGKGGDYDFKVVWETAGSYGNLINSEYEATHTVTTYNSDKIKYVCTDKDAKEAQENITAKIYMKQKSDPDEDYFLSSEAKGMVKIDNDEKKKIIHQPITIFYSDPGDDGGCGRYPMAIFPVEDSAKRYKVVFYNFAPNTVLDGHILETITYSWSKGQRPNNEYNPYTSTNFIHNGNYHVAFSFSGGNCEWIHSLPKPYPGVQAEITYYY